jgi:hypothetical protein
MRKIRPKSILSTTGATPGVLSDISVTAAGEVEILEDSGEGGGAVDLIARSGVEGLESDRDTLEARLDTAETTLATVAGRFTFDGTIGTWAIGKVVYMSDSDSRAVASASVLASAQIEGLIVDISGDNLVTCVGIGGKLTDDDLANLSGAGITISRDTAYYLSLTGTPSLTPPTGYLEVIKEIISNGGVVVEKMGEEIGMESLKLIAATATQIISLSVGVEEYVIIGNSATGINITLPTVTPANSKVKFTFGNKGTGAITIPNTIQGTANRTVATGAAFRTIVDAAGALVII